MGYWFENQNRSGNETSLDKIRSVWNLYAYLDRFEDLTHETGLGEKKPVSKPIKNWVFI